MQYSSNKVQQTNFNSSHAIHLNETHVVHAARKLEIIKKIRNVLDCDQSNYSSRIIFSYTFTIEPNTNWIG